MFRIVFLFTFCSISRGCRWWVVAVVVVFLLIVRCSCRLWLRMVLIFFIVGLFSGMAV